MSAKIRGEQCTATSKATTQRCQRRVIGGGVCIMHGGKAPAVNRKRLERVALAEALAADPRRDPADVLADVAHQADYLMRRAREEVAADRPTAATMTRLIELTERAGLWAKAGIDTGVAERQTRVLEVQAAQLAGVIARILDRLQLTEAQRELVHDVVPAELERLAITDGSER